MASSNLASIKILRNTYWNAAELDGKLFLSSRIPLEKKRPVRTITDCKIEEENAFPSLSASRLDCITRARSHRHDLWWQHCTHQLETRICSCMPAIWRENEKVEGGETTTQLSRERGRRAPLLPLWPMAAAVECHTPRVMEREGERKPPTTHPLSWRSATERAERPRQDSAPTKQF